MQKQKTYNDGGGEHYIEKKENTKNKYRNLFEEEKRSKKTSQKSIKGTIKQKKMKYIFFVSYKNEWKDIKI